MSKFLLWKIFFRIRLFYDVSVEIVLKNIVEICIVFMLQCRGGRAGQLVGLGLMAGRVRREGGRGDDGGLECHIPILKNDFLKNHLESFPDCENVFCT